ncbi:hypothetical protein BB560_001344 [Smittium megazygosporum]|uniref:START domain-containing protein n=1 Tax=Smittium megazygosporum TaxID=133381 RepID=A0A2T9ZHX1_9FUNG|nr:hypothetical protein BB560_001344 [Smittium megazygosporum]
MSDPKNEDPNSESSGALKANAHNEVFRKLSFGIPSISFKSHKQIETSNEPDENYFTLGQNFSNEILRLKNPKKRSSTKKKKTNTKTKSKIDKYLLKSEKSLDKLYTLLSQLSSKSSSPWTNILSIKDEYNLQIYRHNTIENCFVIEALIPSSPGSAFDFMADIENRPSWDKMVQNAFVLQNISKHIKIQYTKMNPVWPTSSRDSLVLGTIKELASEEWPNIHHLADPKSCLRYVSVTTSVEDKRCPVYSSEGVVRMSISVAGYLICSISQKQASSLGLSDYQSWSKMYQVLQADFGGWIPKSVINKVTTKSYPNTFNNLVSELKVREKYIHSKSIKDPEIPEQSFLNSQCNHILSDGSSNNSMRSNSSELCDIQPDDGESALTNTSLKQSGALATTPNIRGFLSHFLDYPR